jgi:hypothetical protein
MRQVVAIDRGDYWEVIGDYSLSPRHASLIGPVWAAEYANSPGYKDMRDSQLGSVAIMAPVGVGKWKKDWSSPYVPA